MFSLPASCALLTFVFVKSIFRLLWAINFPKSTVCLFEDGLLDKKENRERDFDSIFKCLRTLSDMDGRGDSKHFEILLVSYSVKLL